MPAKTHGMSDTKIYSAWKQMRRRCSNPKDHKFSIYGGRGIYVCDEWSDFANFYNDMGDRPKGSTLDRIDNDGPYCKENCKWSTHIEQANNRRIRTIYYRNGLGRFASGSSMPS